MDSRAAFPSLHAAVSLVALVYAWRYVRAWFWVLLPFCLGLWVSTIYLRHHYVVDLLAGWVLAPVAIVGWRRALDALVGARGSARCGYAPPARRRERLTSGLPGRRLGGRGLRWCRSSSAGRPRSG